MKANPGTRVARSAYSTAYIRYCDFYNNQKSSGQGSFASFLGVTRLSALNHNHHNGHITIRKSAADKIMMLNSPHWYALLKAREARIAGKVRRLDKC